ncbi:MAG: hypothetical protein CO189_12160 [candidate division Zixibacteria bacterium CG_4_9_14_3_um_filter_46_8]|nr:MAG: hypothetical protein CO189_12160 [candidate division Zixibacteria bacterium CG_4_9_14_3_um_filter_46_8]
MSQSERPQPSQKISGLISALRQKKGLSQRRLASLSGIPQATINRIESGEIAKPSLENITRIAGALEVTVSELMGEIHSEVRLSSPENRYPAIALIEFSSIAAGITAGDAMVKKAPLVFLKAGTVHPGKYLVLVGGDVASVEESYREGLRIKPESIVDDVILSDVHPQVHDAIMGKKIANRFDALGVIETSTVASNINAADAAVKCAGVTILEIRLADDLGGNSFTLFGGKVEDVEAAIEIGVERIKHRNITIHTTVIPRIDERMAGEIAKASKFFGGDKA